MAVFDEEKLYWEMLLIRKFETRLLELFTEGKLSGTTHTYVGQEAIAVSVMQNLEKKDIVFSNHRCHGHYLAREGDPKGLFAEIMGRVGGVCGGRGGSQHLHRNNFYSNGVQGSYMPIVVGMALAEKRKNSGSIVIAFIGDGTWGEGVVYESLNLAALWRVPLLIVVEDNGYAQSTPKHLNVAGNLLDRPASFQLSCGEIESNDVSILVPRFREVIDAVRSSCKTHVEIVKTYRFNAHSKGDDDRQLDEVNTWRANKDPLDYLRSRLSEDKQFELGQQVDELLFIAEKEATESPYPYLVKAITDEIC